MARRETRPVARLPWRSGRVRLYRRRNDPASRTPGTASRSSSQVDFRGGDGRVCARAFLQQFQERARALGGAPPCVFSEGSRPPREIQSVGAESPSIAGYVSFVIFRSHVATPQKLEKTCDRRWASGTTSTSTSRPRRRTCTCACGGRWRRGSDVATARSDFRQTARRMAASPWKTLRASALTPVGR